ncbi:MAG: hypothetical protein ACYSWZ_00700 [Planctomycetota bacterium]|jgi:hypothetical protein
MDYKSPDSLYNLLPTVYQIRDAEQGYPLRAFLRLIASQVNIVKEDVDLLWDNFFIETCDDWVVPYIGDLVANNPLHDVVRNNRADVAKTIYYRRRKGTLPMLEELARDITGWGCRAVEFFELLGWTQNMNHIRYHSKECPDLRDLNTMDLIDTAFDTVSHIVDVRAIDQIEGWYNIKNIGFFLWRLRSYPLENGVARPLSGPGDHRYHFSSLGNPIPLFHYPLREGDEAGLAQEIHVPTPIRPTAFYNDLESFATGLAAVTTYCDVRKSLLIIKDGTDVSSTDIMCKNLKNWAPVPLGKVGVDVVRGRLAFATGEEPESEVVVSYHYGFSADIGGGRYERRQTLINPENADWEITVCHTPTNPAEVATITDALVEWNAQGKPKGIIHIADNWTYAESLVIEPADDRWLVIEAENNLRPTVQVNGSGNIEITGSHPNSAIILSGLLIEGGTDIQESLGELQLHHCTLVPGHSLDENGNPVHPNSPSIQAADTNTSLEIEIDSSIVGILRLPKEMPRLTLRDSILDGLDTAAIARITTDNEAGPQTILERTTVFGEVFVKELLLANEVIFTGEVSAEKTQVGCVRFSYVPQDSHTPRRFRCQPELALVERARQLNLESVADLPLNEENMILARLKPAFTSIHYGHPAYCQLSYHCPEEIKTGAEDGSEMGTFRHLKQPQREVNLRIRLEEYLPFGLKPGFIYVT